jgi:hypothetical protein
MYVHSTVVDQPTRDAQLAVPIVISADVNLIRDLSVFDHRLIAFAVDFQIDRPTAIKYSFRNISGVDLISFFSDLCCSKLFVLESETSVDDRTAVAFRVTRVMDRYDPLRARRRRVDMLAAGCHLRPDKQTDFVIDSNAAAIVRALRLTNASSFRHLPPAARYLVEKP